MANKPINWKKVLQAGALITEAGSRGSSGGIASKLQEAEIDLSRKFKKNGRPRNVQIKNGEDRLQVNDTLGDFPNIKKTNYNV